LPTDVAATELRAALIATTVIVRRAAPHGDRRDAEKGFHPRRSCAKSSRDTDEGQPMAIWDSINQVYFEDRDSTAGCGGWEWTSLSRKLQIAVGISRRLPIASRKRFGRAFQARQHRKGLLLSLHHGRFRRSQAAVPAAAKPGRSACRSSM